MSEAPAGLDDFINQVPPSPEANRLPADENTPPGLNEFIQPELLQAKYGTPLEQTKAGLEGFAKGVAGPLATLAETKLLNVPAENIRGREEANPGTHFGTELLGFAAPALATAGTSALAKAGIQGAAEALPLIARASKFTQAGLLGEAGAVAGKAAQGAGFVNQIGLDAIKGAFEGAILGAGEEASKALTDDPSQKLPNAVAMIGLSTLLGAAGGPIFGAIGRKLGGEKAAELAPSFVSEMDRAGLEAGEFNSTIKNSNLLSETEKEGIISGLKEQKPDALEIKAAADRLGAPVMEGMTSASRAVQKAEDALINGAPTYSGLRRQKLYNEGYQKAAGAAAEVLGEGSEFSKAELGNTLKQQLTNQITEQNAPIADLYNAIKQGHEIIPLAKEAAPLLEKEISEIKELALSPSSPEGALAKRVVSEFGNLKTVDDLKTYKSILMRSVSPTASSGEKRMASIIADKLTSLEENSIEHYAKNMIAPPEMKANVLELIAKRKEANGFYKELITKVKTLSEQLGKGRIHGAQDAINFINDLTPEQITQRLFSKNNSEFLSFFAKEFPEQMGLMRQYQKGVLKETASKSGELSLKNLFNNVNKLEPEIRKSIFSVEELQKLKDSETYIRSFPKDFNPSHTSHATAFRAFFEHPTGAVIGNARDLAIEGFIKAVGSSPEMNQASALGKAAVQGYKAVSKSVKSVFNPQFATAASLVVTSEASREKLKKLVDEYMKDPEKMMQVGESIPIPELKTQFAQSAVRAVQYLSSIKPKVEKLGPLDPELKPSKMSEAAYDRALDIAEKPLLTIESIKEGNLTPQDIVTLKNVHPELYQGLSQKLHNGMIDHVSKGESIPYSTRLSLSLFLGQALDSTMIPSAIMANQPKSNAPQPQNQQGHSGSKHSMKPLDKLQSIYQTQGQAREVNRNLGKS